MSKYIDINAIPNIYTATHQELVLALEDTPTIDIVRCGECKFSARYVDDGHIECRLYSHPLRHDYHEMKPDDYCSYGERREP